MNVVETPKTWAALFKEKGFLFGCAVVLLSVLVWDHIDNRRRTDELQRQFHEQTVQVLAVVKTNTEALNDFREELSELRQAIARGPLRQ